MAVAQQTKFKILYSIAKKKKKKLIWLLKLTKTLAIKFVFSSIYVMEKKIISSL